MLALAFELTHLSTREVAGVPNNEPQSPPLQAIARADVLQAPRPERIPLQRDLAAAQCRSPSGPVSLAT